MRDLWCVSVPVGKKNASGIESVLYQQYAQLVNIFLYHSQTYVTFVADSSCKNHYWSQQRVTVSMVSWGTRIWNLYCTLGILIYTKTAL